MEINIGIEINSQIKVAGISEIIYLNTEIDMRLITESGLNLIL